MGYQFIHLESYSRKADAKGRDTNFIFGEASRRPEASVHVSAPASPIVVFGIGLDQVQQMHDSAVASATVMVKGGKTRKLRSDQKTLHTVVASHPHTMEDVRADPVKRREAEEWELRTISWLRQQYGDDLKSIIRHEDESHYHLHAYVLPVSDPELRAAKLHPGVTAKRAIMDAGGKVDEGKKALSRRADAAYKQAMREWQDSYHEAVAVPSGLTRLGPQRRRLSREEWQREQVQARSLQQVVQHARKVKASGEEFIARTKTDAAKVKADAERAQEAARQAAAAALAAQDRARQEQKQAHAAMTEAARYRGWFGRFYAFLDRLLKSRVVEKVRSELSREIERWKDVAQTAERQRLEVERQCYETEQKARNASDAALRATIERDRLRSLLSPPVDQAAPEPSAGPKLIPRHKNKGQL